MRHEIKNALRAASNFKSWRSNRKLLVIESDDWGSVRIPNSESLGNLPLQFRKFYNSAYSRFDTVANGEDLEALFEVLGRHRDKNGNPAVFTANAIMANPDFKSIIKSNFGEYTYHTFRYTLDNYYAEDVWSMWLQGISAGVFHPQLHGREHVDVSRWMQMLQEGNEVYLDAIHRGIYAVDYSLGEKKSNLTTALDICNQENLVTKTKALKEAIEIFKENFGFKSLSFIAPSYTWNHEVEKVLKEGGVLFLQGIKNQKIPQLDSEFSYSYKPHYLGERNALSQTYLVRNVFFEPTLLPNSNNLRDALSRINWAFRLGQPAIMGSHRVNYIGAIHRQNREKNLQMLDQLLSIVKRKWPEVEFVTSDQLGKIINASR